MQVRFKIKNGPRKGRVVSFKATSGKKTKGKKTAYQMFIAKKVRAETKKVSKVKRQVVAQEAMVSAAKEWAKKKQKRRARR